jgi:hypothetical protein
MRSVRIAACGLLLAAISATGASAQLKFINKCESAITGVGLPPGTTYNSCAAGRLGLNNLIYVQGAISDVLAQSFDLGPFDVEPAGLTDIVSDEAGERLSPSALTIVATADHVAAPPATRWNAWVDGRYLYSDYDAAAGGLDGPTWSGLAGIDYKLDSKVSVGLLVSAEDTALEKGVNDLNSTSLGGGAYVGIVLTDNIVFSGNLMGTHIDSDQAGGFLEFDTERLQASAGVTGYWYKDTWRFTPGLNFSWSNDWEEEANAFLPDRTIEIGLLTPSLQIGNTLRLSDTLTMEPWAGAALDFTFLNDTHTDGAGTVSDPTTDLRLQAGLNFSFGSNAQLAITGEAGGLLLDDLDSYSIEANLAMQF